MLFTLSLLGCSLALMLNQYQNTQLIYKYPFSVSILGNASSTMESEQAAINGLSPDAVTHVYKVYHNGGEQMRTYYLTHCAPLPNMEEIRATGRAAGLLPA